MSLRAHRSEALGSRVLHWEGDDSTGGRKALGTTALTALGECELET